MNSTQCVSVTVRTSLVLLVCVHWGNPRRPDRGHLELGCPLTAAARNGTIRSIAVRCMPVPSLSRDRPSTPLVVLLSGIHFRLATGRFDAKTWHLRVAAPSTGTDHTVVPKQHNTEESARVPAVCQPRPFAATLPANPSRCRICSAVLRRRAAASTAAGSAGGGAKTAALNWT